MRFAMPNFPCEFELTDEWLTDAGLIDFRSAATSYNSTSPNELKAIREIEPPVRFHTCPKDWLGFDRERLVNVMRGIVSGAEIPPVSVRQFPHEHDFWNEGQYRFRVRDGFHRYYASIAAGFEFLPVLIE
jgi:hypothetical protein